MYVHALHTAHALPDLRTAAGRLRDGFLHEFHLLGTRKIKIMETEFLTSRQTDSQLRKFGS